MISPIFVDANIPIYAAGRAHALKEPCAQIILAIATQPSSFLTDVEVLQELLHYYRSRSRWAEGRDVVRDFATLMQERVEPMYDNDVRRAVTLADTYFDLESRDLFHLALIERLGVQSIVTADRDFDTVSFVTRLDPLAFENWRAALQHPPMRSPNHGLSVAGRQSLEKSESGTSRGAAGPLRPAHSHHL